MDALYMQLEGQHKLQQELAAQAILDGLFEQDPLTVRASLCV